MNISDIKENLCWYDKRNPQYPAWSNKDTKSIDTKCDCNNCTRGKVTLALAMLELQAENDELNLRLKEELQLREQLEGGCEAYIDEVEELKKELEQWKSNTCNELLTIKNKEIEDLKKELNAAKMDAIFHELASDKLQAENDELKKQVEGMGNCENCHNYQFNVNGRVCIVDGWGSKDCIFHKYKYWQPKTNESGD